MTTSYAQNALSKGSQTLSQAKVGTCVLIQTLDGTSCKQLRDMGLAESAEVRKLSCGRNIICIVCGVKLALSKKLADQVFVCAM